MVDAVKELQLKGLFGQQGWRSGENTRLPTMWPGLSLLLVLFLAPRDFSPGTLVFPSLKTNTFKFQFDRTRFNEFLWIPKCSLGKQITYYNYNYRVLSRIYRLGEWPKATSLLGGSGGMPPGSFWNEYALRCNLVHLRHNFEKCYSVFTAHAIPFG